MNDEHDCLAPPPRKNDEHDQSGASPPVAYEHTASLAAILAHLRISLLLTTFEASRLVIVGTRGAPGELVVSTRGLPRPMGIAPRPEMGGLSVAVDTQIWQFGNAPEFVSMIDPAGGYDACYLPRHSVYTGPIDAHEIAWCGNELWVVNTLFSCLCTLNGTHNFVPRWKPRFVTALSADDRCHLNGMAVDGGRPVLVSALGETDGREAWRGGKAAGGCVIEVASGEPVVRGLSMPHSPRVRSGEIWFLESGKGRLARVDRATGSIETVAATAGYGRGLAFAGQYAFIGLSRPRPSSDQRTSLQDLPISERSTALTCGVSVVDLATGREAARLEFPPGVDEIFDVRVLENCQNPLVNGPSPMQDGIRPIWVVPQARGL